MESIIRTFGQGLSTNIEEPVKKHLKNVYATFTMAALCASAGSYVHMFSTLLGSGILTSVGALGSLLWLYGTPYDGKNQVKRLSLLATFAFLTGCNLGPLLEMATMINPTLIMHALLLTTIVFSCFSLAALFAPRGYYLFLGGTLVSLLCTLFWLSLMNLFFGSKLLYQVNLYVSLFVMCGFIVFDTQHIMEKRRSGDKDYIQHSIYLFIDFIAVFKRILIILSNKEASQQQKKRRND